MDLYSNFVHQLCKKYLKKKDKVLDIGCGDGKHTRILTRFSKNVTGGDIHNRLDKNYKIKYKKIATENYGKKEVYDVSTSFDVIEHVEKDLKFVKNMIKTVKKNGLIIIATPNRNRLSNIIIGIIKGPIKYPYNLGYHYQSGGDIIHLREYTVQDFQKLFAKINNARIEKIYSSFVGIYTPIGPIGFKTLNTKFLSKFAQHIFVIVRKNK